MFILRFIPSISSNDFLLPVLRSSLLQLIFDLAKLLHK